MAPNNVLSDIISQIPGKAHLFVNNDTPIQDFIWIEDVVRAIELFILTRCSGIYNIGSGKGISIRDLSELSLK